MKALINPGRDARLVAVSTVLLSAVLLALAPGTAAAASAAPSAVPDRHKHRATRHDELCDGHKWSLFGCRTDERRHRIVALDREALSVSRLTRHR
jgi:hypothetical protein